MKNPTGPKWRVGKSSAVAFLLSPEPGRPDSRIFPKKSSTQAGPPEPQRFPSRADLWRPGTFYESGPDSPSRLSHVRPNSFC